MAEETTSPADQAQEARAGRDVDLVQLAMGIGLVVAMVGVVDGIVMAVKRHVAPCPDGHIFPQGTTNFDCYVHPHAGVGIAISAVSALLGLLVVLTAISAAATFRSPERRPTA